MVPSHEANMRILVIGGAGYIGSHAARRFMTQGHDVWVYDNLHRGHAQAVPANRLIVGSLADGATLENALRQQQIDAVVHFAALTYVGESVSEPALYYRNNVCGTLALLDVMRQCGV